MPHNYQLYFAIEKQNINLFWNTIKIQLEKKGTFPNWKNQEPKWYDKYENIPIESRHPQYWINNKWNEETNGYTNVVIASIFVQSNKSQNEITENIKHFQKWFYKPIIINSWTVLLNGSINTEWGLFILA